MKDTGQTLPCPLESGYCFKTENERELSACVRACESERARASEREKETGGAMSHANTV